MVIIKEGILQPYWNRRTSKKDTSTWKTI